MLDLAMTMGTYADTDPFNPYLEPEVREILSLPRLWGHIPRWYWNPSTKKFIRESASATLTEALAPTN